MEIAVEIASEHGGSARARSDSGGGGGSDGGRGLARRVPPGPLPARHLRRLRGPLGHLRVGDHLGPLRGLPRGGDRGGAREGRRGLRRARRGPRGAPGQLSLHPRLPGRAGALLHGPRPGRPRRRGRAVGRDQGRRLGGADRRGRHDHPPPRGRPRSPALVRPPAPGSLRRRPARRQGRARPAGMLNPGVLIDPLSEPSGPDGRLRHSAPGLSATLSRPDSPLPCDLRAACGP